MGVDVTDEGTGFCCYSLLKVTEEGGVIEVVLLETVRCRKQFDKEVELISRLFNVSKIYKTGH
jgi:hypothetical protein